jgi:hypothetical protein
VSGLFSFPISGSLSFLAHLNQEDHVENLPSIGTANQLEIKDKIN